MYEMAALRRHVMKVKPVYWHLVCCPLVTVPVNMTLAFKYSFRVPQA
jgi:hypothetical protein